MRDRAARGVIVYLTQLSHSSYKGKDSLGLLQASLDTLVLNYLHEHRDDVLLLHTGDFDREADQRRVLSRFSGQDLPIRFHRLADKYWSLPSWIDSNSSRNWLQIEDFSIGYRHMIRFFTIGLWQLCKELGYTHVMRMDEESRIHSRISYNLFHRAHHENTTYAYRQVSFESGARGDRLHAFVRSFLLARGIQPKWLLDHCASPATVEGFSRERCGDLFGIYNNLFLTSVRFWTSPPVEAYLHHIDRLGLIYTHRFNDILWHSTAIQIFAERAQVRLLDDFTYEHATTSKAGCVTYGGISQGSGDDTNETVSRFLRMRFCEGVGPCLQRYTPSGANAKELISATAGTVVVERSDCADAPRHYLCHSANRQHLVTSLARAMPDGKRLGSGAEELRLGTKWLRSMAGTSKAGRAQWLRVHGCDEIENSRT